MIAYQGSVKIMEVIGPAMSLYTEDTVHRVAPTALRQAAEAAGYSPDPSTQNGAVCYRFPDEYSHALVSAGFNHPTLYVRDSKDLYTVLGNRDLKLKYTVHAEEDAIYRAAYQDTEDSKGTLALIALWAACMQCAKTIVQGGVQLMIRDYWWTEKGSERPEWSKNVQEADEYLANHGVTVVDVQRNFNFNTGLRFSGETYSV
jgi:deoxycytidylate deaminase